jgi:hypothetical protein
MKKYISIALTLLLVSCVAACSAKKNFVNKSELDLPEWFNSTDELNGIGVAPESRGGIKYQLAAAELDAKGNLATKIYSEITRITKNALRSANVNQGDDVEEFFTQATKEVVNNIPISGMTRTSTYLAKDGNLYVMMTLKPNDYAKFLKESRTSTLEKLKNQNLARESINKSEEATKAIFDELEKERK